MRPLSFKAKDDETSEEAAERFKDIVISMTGEWLYHISCDGIEEVIKSDSYSFVYFG